MPWKGYAGAKNAAYGTVTWKRARKQQLERDRYQCQLRGPGCTSRATSVDHINGLAADPHHKHLQSACQTCHRAKTAAEGNAAKPAPPLEQRTIW
jgi:5-methylcytosine-specific restriction endonuclease McrA